MLYCSRIISFFLFTIGFSTVYAQSHKGDIEAGGNAGANSGKEL